MCSNSIGSWFWRYKIRNKLRIAVTPLPFIHFQRVEHEVKKFFDFCAENCVTNLRWNQINVQLLVLLLMYTKLFLSFLLLTFSLFFFFIYLVRKVHHKTWIQFETFYLIFFRFCFDFSSNFPLAVILFVVFIFAFDCCC